jgi:Uma2 family endonuclease
MSRAAATHRRRLTAEEFAALPSTPGVRQELIDGTIIEMPPPGFEHGLIADALGRLISLHVTALGLGRVCAAETGFLLRAQHVRAADVAFVRRERIPATRVTGYIGGSPDLAVEVRSPSDSIARVMERIHDWLEHGATEAWLVDPDSRSITVFSAGDHPVRVFQGDQTITCGDWLGGLTIALTDVFPEYDDPEPDGEGASAP